jgi:hypothetical protein
MACSGFDSFEAAFFFITIRTDEAIPGSKPVAFAYHSIKT